MMISAMLPPMVTGPPVLSRATPAHVPGHYPFAIRLPPFSRPFLASKVASWDAVVPRFTLGGWSRGRCYRDTWMRGSACAAALGGRAAGPADGGARPEHRRTGGRAGRRRG